MTMHEEIKAYIEGLFENVPAGARTDEMREEIYRNTIDRFDELVAEGCSEYEAYYKATHSIGDVKGMFSDGFGENENSEDPVDSAALSEEIREYKRSRAITLSTAIVLYILSVVPPIAFSVTSMAGTLGPILMFVMIAVATALLIYRAKTTDQELEYIIKYGMAGTRAASEKAEGSSDRGAHGGEKKDKRWNNPALRVLSDTVNAVTVAVYLIISFLTMAWHITWLVFVISAAIRKILRACDDLSAQ